MFKVTLTTLILTLAFATANAATSSVVTANTVYNGNPLSDPNHVYILRSGLHAIGEGEARASADYGALKTTGFAKLTFLSGENIFNPFFSTLVTSEARFSDSFTVSGAPDGTLGLMSFGLSILGTQTSTAAGGGTNAFASSDWQLDASVAGEIFQNYRSVTKRSGASDSEISTGGNWTNPSFGTEYFTVPIQFGRSINISLILTARAQSVTTPGPSGEFNAIFDLGNSAYWAGISTVTLVDGTAVPDYSVVSSSGTNYIPTMVPVPEPSSWFLMTLGILALVRRTTRPAAVV